jgi:capsular exopolysaccharide synthesis family protein
VTLVQPQSPRAEAYRALRASIQFVRMRGALDRIVIAGISPSDPTESTAANLAVSLAASGTRVGLVDVDMRAGHLHERFERANSPGLTTVLLGDSELDAAIRRIDVPAGELLFLPGGGRPPNPADLVALEALDTLFDEIAKDVDVLLLSAPAVLPYSDAVTLAAHADGIVLVATARRTRRRELAAAAARLRRVGAPAIGVVLDGRGHDDTGFNPSIGELQPARRSGATD